MAEHVSAAFRVPAGLAVEPCRRALAAIDAVHNDGELPSVRIDSMTLEEGMQGFYQPGPPVVIAVAKSAVAPHLTFVHEVGHLLDHRGLGDGGSFGSVGSQHLDGWRTAVQATRAFHTLQELLSGYRGTVFEAHLEYLLTSEELWARSYSQFIAMASGNPILRGELELSRASRGRVYIPRQWDDNDFVSVAESIFALFRTKGWLP